MATRKSKEPTVIAESCKECRFSKNIRGDGLYCRRYPPALVYDASTGTNAPAFPEVDPVMWCGEWSPPLNS
ncbi:MAG TPA: hypothetical protein VIY48_06090 [Candidatus Paceibacterota bacterium]